MLMDLPLAQSAWNRLQRRAQSAQSGRSPLGQRAATCPCWPSCCPFRFCAVPKAW